MTYCACRCLVYNWFTDYIPTVFHTTSVWLTVTLAAQRYIYVCHTVIAKRLCTVDNIVKASRHNTHFFSSSSLYRSIVSSILAVP